MPPHTNADTPVMRQYLEVKGRYPDCIVFFRLGDFYEMFFEDAVECARLLDLTLTSRDKGKEDGVPMCGVPHHAARFYVGKLIEAGRKVAICDQVEDARLARKIVRREVTQVVTPGVVLDEEQLQPKASHYLAAVCPGSGPAIGLSGVAYLDVSTGEFAATQLPLADAVEELCRIEPREVLVVGGLPQGDGLAGHPLADLPRRLRVPIGAAPLTGPGEEADGEGAAALREVLGPTYDDVAETLSAWPLAAQAAAACVRYARATQPAGTLPIVRLTLYQPGDEVVIDEATKANLELFQTAMDRKRQGSLLGLIDQTNTAMGGRLLRRWLGAPLRKVGEIHRRLDAVEWLFGRQRLRDEVRAALAEVHDIERLTGRLSLGVVTPRDLACLRRSLERLQPLSHAFAAALRQSAEAASQALGLSVPEAVDLGADLCQDVAAAIAAQIIDDPAANYREGGFIRRGYSAELDELEDISKGGKDHILRIEERERERTGISSLKVRYNKVFGYYIEITRSNLAKVPPEYTRKQTLAGAERYVTQELTEYEAKVLGADERRLELELSIFEALKRTLLPQASRLLQLAGRVARLDVVASLAEVAHRYGYVRPEIDDGLRLSIEDGRHPVVERLAAAGTFVPNDVTLDPDEGQLVILTGPNMAGKSTVMRQVALIAVMGQMGSFVPAKRARIGVVDRVFTRVGAADNLARGESTFMVEMRETANILRHASRRSLVILDEIGRGTSTYDGVSIAWAVAEHLHDGIGCKTLFATHYHELCALAGSHKRVRNLSVAVREWQGEIVFLHRLVEGGASRSYGIEVARLAGLPHRVVDRARAILAALESGEDREANLPTHGMPERGSGQLALFGLPVGQAAASAGAGAGARRRKAESNVASHQAPAAAVAAAPAAAVAAAPGAPAVVPAVAPGEQEVLQRMRKLDCDGMTPREALHLMAELCERLRAS
jgi:DNA mismatch repair protein MutS